MLEKAEQERKAESKEKEQYDGQLSERGEFFCRSTRLRLLQWARRNLCSRKAAARCLWRPAWCRSK